MKYTVIKVGDMVKRPKWSKYHKVTGTTADKRFWIGHQRYSMTGEWLIKNTNNYEVYV